MVSEEERISMILQGRGLELEFEYDWDEEPTDCVERWEE